MDKLTALVTGASRGIGFAIARRIAPHATTLLLSSRQRTRVAKAQRDLARLTDAEVLATHCDHARGRPAALHTAKWARSAVSSLDLLVLNAGYYVEGSLSRARPSDFEENLRVNFIINHYLVQELLPLIKRSRLKRIVLIGSTAGYEAYPAVPTYGVAKWALRGYAVNLRRELIKEGVGVTLVSPGGTLTDMWAGEKIPPNRLLDPDDVAKLVVALTTLSSQAVVEELVVRPILGDMHD